MRTWKGLLEAIANMLNYLKQVSSHTAWAQDTCMLQKASWPVILKTNLQLTGTVLSISSIPAQLANTLGLMNVNKNSEPSSFAKTVNCENYCHCH